ncbi:exonuclease iii ape [Cystoisospora suis]|uniref:DNA-(apurinic or apyrimidinic site) endonuclease n=1 Tax=Cystoisospora suis TaxID=483139 RepID=A0A2C6KFM8_9APIC|nr:exonuclease iii ape [Cystoisospora suis]
MAAQGPPGAKRGDGMPREQNKMKTTDRSSSAEAKDVNEAISEALPGHVCLISLADWKYSGQMMFLKKDLYVRSVRFNLSLDSLPPDKHDPEGRVIAADFEPFVVLTTYSPNNGGNKKSFERRRLWDERMKKFVQGVQKPLIWVGDLNCAPEDVDLSDPERFRSVIHEEPGEPIDPDNIGQAGCTDAERRRFASILQAGDLVDAFRVLNPRKEPPSLESAEYSWRGKPCWGGRGPRALFKGLGMRLDHVILSESLMKAVEDVRICGSGTQMRNFFGSDHCPVLLRLKEEVACALPSFESDAFSPAHSVTAAVGGSSKTKGLANYWASKGENRSAQPKAKTEDVVVLSDSSADGEKDGKRKGK